jgi:Ser/Thr protein kinase RdoA (MazF antagonist)
MNRASIDVVTETKAQQKALSRYRLGRIDSIEPAPGGMTSDNWFIEAARGKYFLRRRNPIFSRESIEFELGLIEYLVSVGFPTARLIGTKDGRLYFMEECSYWELYEYLPGGRFCTADLDQTRSAAGLLASFHESAASYRAKPVADRIFDISRIEGFIDVFEEELKTRAKMLGIVLAPSLAGFFRGQADMLMKGLEPLFGEQLVLIHGDFQPSNILFNGSDAIALLDYGDSGFSYRAYDVAKAVLRFATLRPDYESQRDIDPVLDLERVVAFMSAYQAQAGLPLSKTEISVMPDLLKGVFLYDVGFFLGKEPNPFKQIFWLHSAWQFSRLIDRSAEDLRSLLLQTCNI